jgi:hypothetical protein
MEGRDIVKRPLPALVALLAATTMAACTTDSALNPSAQQSSGTPAAAAPGTASGVSATPPASPQEIAAILSQQRLQFAPIVGATVESVAPLSKRLAADARERGITIVAASDPSTTLLMKGYFSALTEGKQTTVIYVWDVLDPSGNRLHRIEGQEKVPSNGAQGFAAVKDATMEEIADQTVDQLVAWLSTRKV